MRRGVDTRRQLIDQRHEIGDLDTAEVSMSRAQRYVAW